MKVLLIGYGKMGQAIEKLLVERGHHVFGVINIDNTDELDQFDGQSVDVAIEFTQPEVAVHNITQCIRQGIRVISGTTGWLDRYAEVEALCHEKKGAFLFASNFSLGVNLLFKVNAWLAQLISPHNYNASLEEIHHVHKKDAPSGTAITLAESVLNHNKQLTGWTLSNEEGKLPIQSVREGEVPGTHKIRYSSAVDRIEISHEAFSLEGFVLGAVLVAEWIKDKKGVLTMDDFLDQSINFE